jgi:hypothetical protein
LWNDVMCNWRASAVSCMVDKWVMSNSTSTVMTFPPRQTSNLVRPIIYDVNNSFKMIDPVADMTILVDDALIYGMTLQLAVQHCMVYDKIDVPNRAAFPNMTFIYDMSLCALFVAGEAYVWEYKIVANAARFYTPTTPVANRQRTQLSFAWIAWPTTFDFNVTLEHQSRAVFTHRSVNSTGPVSWIRINEACNQLGAYWFAASVINRWEAKLIERMPIVGRYVAMSLRRADTGAFSWGSFPNPDPMVYIDWQIDVTDRYPKTATPADDNKRCGYIDRTNNHWRNSECYGAYYNTAVCKNRDWILYGTVSFIAQVTESYYPTKMQFRRMLFKRVPTPTSAIVYGATVNGEARKCDARRWPQYAADRFGMETSEDRIVKVSEDTCSIMFAGTATVTEYSNIISGISWFGTENNTRASVRFGYVLWEDKYMHDIIIDLDTLRQYTTVVATLSLDTVSTYPFQPASAVCYGTGWALFEAQTEPESRNQHITTKYGDAIINAKRTTTPATSPYKWMSDGTFQNYTEFDPAIGQIAVAACLRRTVGGYQAQILCTDPAPSVACEKPLTVYTNQAAFTIKTRLINWAADQSFKAFDMNVTGWVETSRNGYGVTLQIHPEQCDVLNDKFDWYGAHPTTTGYVVTTLSLCITFLTNPSPKSVGDYLDIVGRTKYITTSANLLGRTQFSFAWLIWTSVQVTNLMMNFEMGRSYMMTNPGTFIYFDQAASVCANAGNGMELPVISAKHEADILRVLVGGSVQHIALQSKRNASGTFIWQNGEPMSYMEWDAGYPTALGDCLVMTMNAFTKWRQVDCTDPMFSRVACEGPQWDYSQIQSWIIAPAGEAVMIIDGVFPPSAFADVNAPAMYGATIQTARSQCRYLDTYMFRRSHDYIANIDISDCVMRLSGFAPMEAYNLVLGGIQWRASYPYGEVDGEVRSTLTVGYIYWKTKFVRDMGFDFQSGFAYASFSATLYYDKTSWQQVMGKFFCQQFDLYPVEIYSDDQAIEQQRTQRYGDMYTGGVRDPQTTVFNWTSATRTDPVQQLGLATAVRHRTAVHEPARHR